MLDTVDTLDEVDEALEHVRVNCDSSFEWLPNDDEQMSDWTEPCWCLILVNNEDM